jgi:hypothetical protein
LCKRHAYGPCDGHGGSNRPAIGHHFFQSGSPKADDWRLPARVLKMP